LKVHNLIDANKRSKLACQNMIDLKGKLSKKLKAVKSVNANVLIADINNNNLALKFVSESINMIDLQASS